MNFKEFKKEIKSKKEQEDTMREINSAIITLTNKRDNYASRAKEALKQGNTSQYNAMVALLKNSVFNLKQAQDMVANFTIARDMCEMQMLNKKFVKSLNSVMGDVYKTCKAIHVSSSEKMFMKALYQQSQTSAQLQQALQSNNISFSSSVNALSDISDEEIKTFLQEDINIDEKNVDAELDMLEKNIRNLTTEKASSDKNMQIQEVGNVDSNNLSRVNNTVAQNTSQNVANGYINSSSKENANNSANTRKSEENYSANVKQPEKNELSNTSASSTAVEDELLSVEEGGFVWNNIPTIGFEDIAGLEDVKDVVRIKVLLPLSNPDAFEGYEKKNGGGLCLYGPPGTGKTMIAAAIAKEIGAKFCSVKPSDLLQQGAGNTEKAVRILFQQARKFPCAVICFDEMDSISPKSTKSQYARQLRSEFLSQLQGVESYGEKNKNILFLICATNKPWDIDSAFLRPGRFGTKIYVGLPDDAARRYMVEKRLEKIGKKGVVQIAEDFDTNKLVEESKGFNGSDISNLLDRIEELSIIRGIKTGKKYIGNEDVVASLEDVHASVQTDDLIKLKEWRDENDK